MIFYVKNLNFYVKNPNFSLSQVKMYDIYTVLKSRSSRVSGIVKNGADYDIYLQSRSSDALKGLHEIDVNGAKYVWEWLGDGGVMENRLSSQYTKQVLEYQQKPITKDDVQSIIIRNFDRITRLYFNMQRKSDPAKHHGYIFQEFWHIEPTLIKHADSIIAVHIPHSEQSGFILDISLAYCPHVNDITSIYTNETIPTIRAAMKNLKNLHLINETNKPT